MLIRLVAPMVVVALFIVGCGSDDSGSTGSDAAATQTTAGIPLQPIAGVDDPIDENTAMTSANASNEGTGTPQTDETFRDDTRTDDNRADDNGADDTADIPDGEEAVIETVIDGDTLRTTSGERVRLIGINTPEVDGPYRDSECGGSSASAFTKRLLPAGTSIVLVDDVERYDDYDRRLAYVYRADNGLFVNAAIVREGFAESRSYRPNTAMQDLLDDSEQYARDRNRGIWSECQG